MSTSVTVVIPCLNERLGVEDTYEAARRAAERHFRDHEIIIVDDASTDETGAIADAIAARDSRVTVLHNERNRGFGAGFRAGLERARSDYVIAVPGDNEIDAASVDAILSAAGPADLVLGYPVNTHVRPLARRWLSRTFTALMNVLTGCGVRYYNGPVLYRREQLTGVPIETEGFAFQADLVTRLLGAGATFREVAMELRMTPGRRSKAFRPRNVASVIVTVVRLAVRTRLARLSKKPAY